MTLQELRQLYASLCDQQQEVISAVVAEARGMTDEEKAKFGNLQTQIDGMDNTIKTAEKIEARNAELDKPADPLVRPVVDSTQKQTEVKDDAGFKNFGEFLHAVRYGDSKGRLANMGANDGGGIAVPEAFRDQLLIRPKNEWSAGVGSEGGIMIPGQMRTDILMAQPEMSIVRPRATVIEPGDPPDAEVTIPALNQGSNGVFGGVQVYWIGEGDTKPETDGKLQEIKLTPQEVAAHTIVTDKLLRNWTAASTFISTILRKAIVNAEDVAFLRGNGVAKPMGVINSSGAIIVARGTANQINYADVVSMMAALMQESVSNAVWIISQSAMPEIITLQDALGNYIFIQGDATKGIPATLCGIPVKFTGKTVALGAKGDIMLVDLTYYLIKDGSGPFVAASEHVLFRQNKTVIKIFWNTDGQGWVKDPLLLEDGTTTVSPFVILQ